MRTHFSPRHSPASRLAAISLVPVLLGLFGCASTMPSGSEIDGPAVDARPVEIPTEYSERQELPEVDSTEIGAAWLESFGDSTLEALVQEAWEHNPDLSVTAARFDEARANLRVAASRLYPQLDASGRAAYTEVDGDGDGGGDDEYSAGAAISWEVDLWGRIRADRSAGESIAAAAGLDFIQARHSLAAAVAQAYFAIVTAKERLEIDQLLLEAEQFTLETTRQRVDAGLVTILDENLAASSVYLAEAAVRDDRAALREARRALEVLLGRYPAAELDAIPATLPELDARPVAVGVPTTLLERRPDIRSAELLVDAASFDLESARAARLPRLTLSADARTLIDPSDFVTTVLADILAPLFQGGRLRAEVDAAEARQRGAVGQFATVALRAFREVESSLSQLRTLGEREARLRSASESLRGASEVAISRYEEGLLPILDLQQVRRRDFETRVLLLGVRFERIRQQLSLYLALGGPVLGPTVNHQRTAPEDEDDS